MTNNNMTKRKFDLWDYHITNPKRFQCKEFYELKFCHSRLAVFRGDDNNDDIDDNDDIFTVYDTWYGNV
jgi:hypothetical protein